jgi:hypothetical protein
VSVYINDLAPFSADGCWMLVLLAREANVGVIIRRGPTKWWHITLWDTRLDQFTPGQWFHGQMYPEKCDLSPDGKLLIYFAGKFRAREVAKGYGSTWTAVSRPPYLTALALWPMGDTWGGNGVFLDNRTVLLTTSSLSFGAKHHPDHPPGPLNVVEYYPMRDEDLRRDAVPCWLFRWERAASGSWKKTCGDLTIEGQGRFSGSYPSIYTLYRNEGEPLGTFEANWADWDQQGRLVATAGGRVLEGNLTKGRGLLWRQLAAMNEEKPTPMETPEWAQRW